MPAKGAAMQGAFGRLVVLTTALAVRLSCASNEVLPTDDECAGGSTEDQTQCALNALQLRAGKLLSKKEEGHAAGVAAERPTIRLELYRAMRKKDLKRDLANVDMASIAGIMNYLHTDVVGEHVDDYAGYEPKIGAHERINGMEVVAATELYVRNPDSVVSSVGNFVDFALSAHFITGEATGPAYNWNFGDIVGAIQGEDPRYPVSNPYYRFSLSGYCPNLKWVQKKKGAIDAIKDFKKREGGGAKPESGRRRRRQPGLCMTYSNQFNLPYGEVLKGGLCPNGTDADARPTGGPGCVYTYTPPQGHDVVSLDDLVGVTKEDCGGRLCRNWKDFRRHCSNKHYHRKFNYKSRRRYSTLLRSKLCIEYDIHKDCAKNCNSAKCHKVPPNKRELGLPFWRGRCSAHLNAQRAERLAQAFGVASAGKGHQLLKKLSNDTCLSTEKMCHPDPNSGGMYCSRAWAGICQPCYIPNTAQTYIEAKTTPICPWSVLMSSDYANKPKLQPNCSTTLPRDLCCLYSGTCDAKLTSEPLPVTEDGFAYAASMQDTKKMADFLQRAAHQAYAANVTNLVKLRGFAYWQWGLAPIVGKTFPEVMRSLRHYLL